MTDVDLAAELDAARLGLHVADARIALAEQGAQMGTLRTWPAVGAATIERCGRNFQFMPGGEMALIIGEPIRCNDDLADPAWRLLDLVAIPLAEPTIMLTRLDLAWGLGEYRVSQALAFDQPLYVYPDAIEWLKADRAGLVLIDEDDVWFRLGWVREIRVQCPQLARRLDRLVTPPVLPKPIVMAPPTMLKEARHV